MAFIHCCGQVKETTYRYETDKRTTRINFDDKPKNLTKEWRPATTKKNGAELKSQTSKTKISE